MNGFVSSSALLTMVALSASLGSALTGCNPSPEYVELPKVAAAPSHHEAKAFLVKGKALTDQMVDYTWTQTLRTKEGPSSGSVERHTYLIPVVDDGWKPGQPIPMWVTCPSTKMCMKGPHIWLAQITTMFDGETAKVEVADRVGRPTTFHEPASQWLNGAEAASKKGLTSVGNAPIVRWPVESL